MVPKRCQAACTKSKNPQRGLLTLCQTAGRDISVSPDANLPVVLLAARRGARNSLSSGFPELQDQGQGGWELLTAGALSGSGSSSPANILPESDSMCTVLLLPQISLNRESLMGKSSWGRIWRHIVTAVRPTRHLWKQRGIHCNCNGAQTLRELRARWVRPFHSDPEQRSPILCSKRDRTGGPCIRERSQIKERATRSLCGG